MPIQNAVNIRLPGVVSLSPNNLIQASPVTNRAVIFGDVDNKLSSLVLNKGDMVVGDNAANRLSVGSDTQVLTADSTQPSGVKWATPASGISTLHGAPAPVDVNTITYFSDFLEENGQGFWEYPQNFKEDIGITPSKINNLNPGIGKIGAEARIALSKETSSRVGTYIGNGTITMALRINFDGSTPLVSGNKFFWGLKDRGNFSTDNEAIGIYVDPDVNATPNWIAKTTTGGVSTYTDLGVTADDFNAWRVLKLVINSAATSVDFYIDGVLLATHTTNIPPVTTRFASGTVASLPLYTYLLDYALYNQVCSNDRS